MQTYRKISNILVSGGSSGIGEAIIARFLAEKINCIIADRQEPSLVHPGLSFIRADLEQPGAEAEIYRKLQDDDRLPDVLICNAGRGILEKISEGDPQKWEKVFALNVMGTLRLIRAFLPPMLSRGYGDLVVISSVAAAHPHEFGGVYGASKSAINQIAETVRLESSPPIRVTTISPGVVDTPFFSSMVSGYQSIDEIGWGSLEARDLADAVWYAVTRPAHYAVNNITLRPLAQKM